MRFISPRTDYAFKKIFGSENSEDILISFLNAILNLKGKNEIKSLKIIDPFNLPKIRGLKNSCVDVKAKTKCNKNIIIEMQIAREAGFKQRVLYNTVKQYSNQIKTAEKYTNLNPVISVTISDFVTIENPLARERYINYFVFKENDKQFNFFNNNEEEVMMFFVELPKFKKTLKQLKTIQDKWIYFLKTAENLEIVPKELNKDVAINEAFEIANRSNLTEKELEVLERVEMFKTQQKQQIIYGEQKGREEGREKGKKEKMIEIARNMLRGKMPIDVIIKYTGLTKEDIQGL